jgi:hypothetical protein
MTQYLNITKRLYKLSKFWLRKVALADNLGFAKKELNELHGMVSQHQKHLLDQWNEYFGA